MLNIMFYINLNINIMFYINLNIIIGHFECMLCIYALYVLNGVFEVGIANDTLRCFDEFGNIVAGVIYSFHSQSLILILRRSLNDNKRRLLVVNHLIDQENTIKKSGGGRELRKGRDITKRRKGAQR